MNEGGALAAGRLWRRESLLRLPSLLLRDTSVTVISVVFSNLLRALSSIALTRLLLPEVFGIAGIIASISFVLTMISDLGFQAFVVRHADGDKPRFLNAIWTIRLLRSAGLTIALMLLAWPIAQVLGKPELAPVIAASSWLFVIEGCSSLSLVTALRDRQLVRLSSLEAGVSVLQLVLSVAFASLWANYWSILAAMLLTEAAKSAASYRVFNNAGRRLVFDPVYSRELWRFARYVTGSSIISLVLVQTDKVVLARVFPLHALGLYMLATNLALAPSSFVSSYASRVLFPHYARVWRETPERLLEESYARRWRVSILYMIAAGGIAGGADLIVGILYDPRYAAAALYLRILAITPLLVLSSMAANEVLTASGRIQVTLHANMAKLVWLALAGPAAFWAAGPIGIVAVAGTLELPTVLYSWAQLHRFGLLQWKRELALLGFGALGVVGGLLAERLILPLI